MGNDYLATICNCGRIHLVDNSCIEVNKDFMYVCTNCGAVKIITKLNKDNFLIKEVNDRCVNSKNINQILISSGHKVIMKTGGEANYHGYVFIDINTPRDVIKYTEEEWVAVRKVIDIDATLKEINLSKTSGLVELLTSKENITYKMIHNNKGEV